MSILTIKLCEIMFSSFRGVELTNCFGSIFHFCQISKFKRSIIPRKKIKSKFSVNIHIMSLITTKFHEIFCEYRHLHIMSLITTKFHEILLNSFRGVALTKKKPNQDWLTDRSKTLYPPQLVAWGIIIHTLHVFLCWKATFYPPKILFTQHKLL